MSSSSRVGAVLFVVAVAASLAAAQNREEEPFSVRANAGGAVPEHVMPAIDERAVKALDVDTKPGPWRFAVPQDAHITLADGQWQLVGDNWLWRLRISSVGAKHLNLGFTRYLMPAGGRLYLYPATYAGGNAAEEVYRFGPEDNEAHGQLWTPIVRGPSLIIEVVVPKAARPQLRLVLTKVNYGYRGFEKADFTIKSGSCNVDVVCPEGDPYQNQIRAVARLQLNGSALCSGSMLNNTGARRALFITADHCGLRASNAATLVVYWNFQNSSCRPVGGSASGGDGNGSLSQFNSGSIFLATSSTSDFTLAELDDAPQSAFNVYLAGWDRRPGPFADGAVGIHHPNVDEKRISIANRATEDDGGTHHKIWWRPNGIGVTEPGSSGSAIYTKQGRFMGQLTGGGSACGAADADMWDVYGKLAASWDGGGTAGSRARDYLDPLGTAPQTIDGRNWNDAATPTPTLRPTATPTATLRPTATSTATPTATARATATVTPRPTATSTSTPTTRPRPTATPSSIVTLYQHCDFTGWAATFGAGSFTRANLEAAGGVNDAVSSVRVAAGYRVTLYQHNNFGGTSITLTGDDNCLVDNSFNDIVSSFQVQAVTP